MPEEQMTYNGIKMGVLRSNCTRRIQYTPDNSDYESTIWRVSIMGNISRGAVRYMEGEEWPPAEQPELDGVPLFPYDPAEVDPGLATNTPNRYHATPTDRALRQRLMQPRRNFLWQLVTRFSRDNIAADPGNPNNYNSTIIEVFPANTLNTNRGGQGREREDKQRWSDCWMGPRPIDFGIIAVNGEGWIIFNWVIEFTIRELSYSKDKGQPLIIGHRFSQFADIGPDQLEVRHVQGYVRLNRTMLENKDVFADQYRSLFFHPVHPRMQRTNVRTVQTEDPTVYKYSFTDTQQYFSKGQYARDNGVLWIEATHEEASEFSMPSLGLGRFGQQVMRELTNIGSLGVINPIINSAQAVPILGPFLGLMRIAASSGNAGSLAKFGAEAARRLTNTYDTTLNVTVKGEPDSNKENLMEVALRILAPRVVPDNGQMLSRGISITWHLHLKVVQIACRVGHSGNAGSTKDLFPSTGIPGRGKFYPTDLGEAVPTGSTATGALDGEFALDLPETIPMPLLPNDEGTRGLVTEKLLAQLLTNNQDENPASPTNRTNDYNAPSYNDPEAPAFLP